MDGPPQYKSNHGMAGFMNRRSFGIGGDFYGWGTRFWSDFGLAFGGGAGFWGGVRWILGGGTGYLGGIVL